MACQTDAPGVCDATVGQCVATPVTAGAEDAAGPVHDREVQGALIASNSSDTPQTIPFPSINTARRLTGKQ